MKYRIRILACGNDRLLQVYDRLSMHPDDLQIIHLRRGILFNIVWRDYYPGRTLGEIARSGETFTLEEVVDIMTGLCGRLDYVHSPGVGVLHLDIQPDNLIWHEGSLRLIDFGNACAIGALRNGNLSGTVGYAAPEMYEGRDVDERTDIFSAGRVLGFLLEHSRYSEDRSADGHVCGRAEGIGGVRYQMLLKIVRDCTRFHMGRRIGSATQLRCRLETVRASYFLPQNRKTERVDTM